MVKRAIIQQSPPHVFHQYGYALWMDSQPVDLGIPEVGDAFVVFRNKSERLAGLIRMPGVLKHEQERHVDGYAIDEDGVNPYETWMDELDRPDMLEAGILLIAGDRAGFEMQRPPAWTQQLLMTTADMNMAVGALAMVRVEGIGASLVFDPTSGTMTFEGDAVLSLGDGQQEDLAEGILQGVREGAPLLHRYCFLREQKAIVDRYLVPTAIGLWSRKPYIISRELGSLAKGIRHTQMHFRKNSLTRTYGRWWSQLPSL